MEKPKTIYDIQRQREYRLRLIEPEDPGEDEVATAHGVLGLKSGGQPHSHAVPDFT
jgi:hypothetical protein